MKMAPRSVLHISAFLKERVVRAGSRKFKINMRKLLTYNGMLARALLPANIVAKCWNLPIVLLIQPLL